MLVFQVEAADAGGQEANSDDDDVMTAHVGLPQDAAEVRHVVIVADGDEDAAGAGMDTFGTDLGLDFEVKGFEALAFSFVMPAVDALGNGEDGEEEEREGNAVDGGDFLGEQVGDRDHEQHGSGGEQAVRDLNARDSEVAGVLVFLILTLKAKNKNAEGFEEEAPDHTEGIGFTEDVHVPLAEDDGDHLEDGDGVDEAVGGAEAGVGLAEPVDQNAIFGDAVENAVGAEDGRVDGPGEDEDTNGHDENVEGELEGFGAGQIHGEAAEKVLGILTANGIGDNKAGEESDDAGTGDGVEADGVGGELQVAELGVSDLAVDLSQGFEAGHGQQGVAEGDDDGGNQHAGPDRTFEPAEALITEFDGL